MVATPLPVGAINGAAIVIATLLLSMVLLPEKEPNAPLTYTPVSAGRNAACVVTALSVPPLKFR